MHHSLLLGRAHAIDVIRKHNRTVTGAIIGCGKLIGSQSDFRDGPCLLRDSMCRTSEGRTRQRDHLPRCSHWRTPPQLALIATWAGGVQAPIYLLFTLVGERGFEPPAPGPEPRFRAIG